MAEDKQLLVYLSCLSKYLPRLLYYAPNFKEVGGGVGGMHIASGVFIHPSICPFVTFFDA